MGKLPNPLKVSPARRIYSIWNVRDTDHRLEGAKEEEKVEGTLVGVVIYDHLNSFTDVLG